MSLSKQIFTHGWLGNSISLFTLGYHPRSLSETTEYPIFLGNKIFNMM